MRAALRAGLAYFAFVFAVGFFFGTIRTLALAPEIGEVRATLVELPFMLAACWMICIWLVGRFQVPPRFAPRLLMGGVALFFLLLAETGLALAFLGESPWQYLTSLGSPARALGLAGQVLFAAMPLLAGIRSTV